MRSALGILSKFEPSCFEYVSGFVLRISNFISRHYSLVTAFWALEYIDRTYELTKQLPDSERYNLRSQLERASTSIALNIAEGSTGQSDAEQNRPGCSSPEGETS